MKVYAVIDTNVLASALLAKHPDAAPVRIFECMLDKDIVPMFNDEILAEYNEVLRRAKFHFSDDAIVWALNALIEAGIDSERVPVEDTATCVGISRLVAGCLRPMAGSPRHQDPNSNFGYRRIPGWYPVAR